MKPKLSTPKEQIATLRTRVERDIGKAAIWGYSSTRKPQPPKEAA